VKGVTVKTLSGARAENSLGYIASPEYNRRNFLVRSPIWENKDLLERKFCVMCNRVMFGTPSVLDIEEKFMEWKQHRRATNEEKVMM
jgi:hypothetical protein